MLSVPATTPGAPAVEGFARLREVAAVDEIGERMSGRLRSRASKPCKTSKHCLGLNEVNVCHLPAVAPMPAERSPLEAGRLRVEEKKDELQRVR
jgi:hypothetical protein